MTGVVDSILKVLAPQTNNGKGGGTGLDTTSHPYIVRCEGDPDPNNPGGFINQHAIGWLSAPPGEVLIAFPLRDANGDAVSNIPDDSCFSPAPHVTFDPGNPVCPCLKSDGTVCGKSLVL